MREEGGMNLSQQFQAKAAKQAIGDAVVGCAGRQSSKAMLLDHAELLRRKANQLEGLAYAIEHLGGDAEITLHGLLSSEIYRR